MRRRVLTMLVIGGMTAGLAPAALAQEAGDVGVTMGYPGAVGVVWHITDAFALRPDLSLTSTTTDSTTVPNGPGGSSTSSDSWNTALGLSALVTVAEINPVQAGARTNFPRLRLYVAPRFAYSRTSTDSETGSGGAASSFDSTTKVITVSGSFGAQYSLHDRFALFGELGLQFSKTTATSDFLDVVNDSEAKSFGVRSAIGVTYYF